MKNGKSKLLYFIIFLLLVTLISITFSKKKDKTKTNYVSNEALLEEFHTLKKEDIVKIEVYTSRNEYMFDIDDDIQIELFAKSLNTVTEYSPSHPSSKKSYILKVKLETGGSYSIIISRLQSKDRKIYMSYYGETIVNDPSTIGNTHNVILKITSYEILLWCIDNGLFDEEWLDNYPMD